MESGCLSCRTMKIGKADCQEQARILAFLQKNTPEDCSNGMQEEEITRKNQSSEAEPIVPEETSENQGGIFPRDETVRIEILAYNENWLPVVSRKFLLQKILQRHRHF